jgi:hypothetical protein
MELADNLVARFKNDFKYELEKVQLDNPKHKRYSKEFQVAIIDLLKEGVPPRIIKQEFKISASSIFFWGKNSSPSKPKNYSYKSNSKNKSIGNFIELNFGQGSNGDKCQTEKKAISSGNLKNEPARLYDLTTPSGYKIQSLIKDELISIILSLENKHPVPFL